MKTIVVMSGGLDSTTLLYDLLKADHTVEALSFDYGQRHARELVSAQAICSVLDVPWMRADLSAIGAIIAGSSSLLNRDVAVPHGHYADVSMKKTVVPNRNMIMLSVAIGHAIARGFEAVAFGAHAGDHAIYPDCRPAFAAAMDTAALLCDWTEVRVLRPFVHMTKTQIVRRGFDLAVPFERTWSCYEGGEVHCGKCGTCVERKEAFSLAEVVDPTRYEAA